MSSHHNSLRWRSGVNLVVIAAALVAITVITNAYSFNLMLRNFRQSLSSTAQIYTEQISGKVDKINSGSLELVSLAASSQNYYTSSPLGRYVIHGITAAANLRLFIPAFFLPRPPPKAAYRIPHAALNHNQIPCTAPFSAKFSCKVSHRQL